MLSFKQINLFTLFVSFTLCLILLAFPEFIYFLFQIDGNETANFMSRRAGFLFLGFAALLFFSKDIVVSELQRPIIICIFLAMIGLATLGIFEFIRGFAGPGIFLAVITEVFIAVNYLLLLKKTG